MHRMEGKRALVTAAGQGIGRASALRLAREGAAVLATDIDAAALADLAAQDAGKGQIETRVMDVRDPAAITAGVMAAGRIDALVSCAGFVANGTILDNVGALAPPVGGDWQRGEAEEPSGGQASSSTVGWGHPAAVDAVHGSALVPQQPMRRETALPSWNSQSIDAFFSDF